jgi:cyanophycin synthetase
MARIASEAFDHVIVRRDDDLRGRAPEEVPKILEAELLRRGYAKEKITVIPDEQLAIHAALGMAKRGDLLLVFADAVSRSWKQIIYWKSESDGQTKPSSIPPAPHAPSPPLSVRAPLVPAFAGEAVIHDERGVRLARETED